MIVNQRAFVFVKNISAVVISDTSSGYSAPHVWRITAVFENSGDTPAKKLLSCISWENFENEITDRFDFPDKSKPTYAFVGPKAIIHSNHIDIPYDAIDRATNFSDLFHYHIYLWGWVEYNDVFNETKRHRTEFCYKIEMDRGAMSFRAHHKHNAADEECYRQPSPYVPPS